METCFVPARDVRAFVAGRPEAAGAPALEAGEIRDVAGRRLGEHAGVASYTVGQRKGLGISTGEPQYVVRLEADANVVVVGGAGEEFSSGFTAAAVSWTRGVPAGPRRAEVRIRHRHAPAAAALEPRPDGSVAVRFDAPQRAVAPGQAAVFYEAEEVLGGGTIVNGGAA
jgi:tRNA-specific 2-thiouridylase